MIEMVITFSSAANFRKVRMRAPSFSSYVDLSPPKDLLLCAKVLQSPPKDLLLCAKVLRAEAKAVLPLDQRRSGR
jgi:hypothetical protein